MMRMVEIHYDDDDDDDVDADKEKGPESHLYLNEVDHNDYNFLSNKKKDY